MEYSKLVAVSGMPGLFELINSKTDGAIVRSLEDQSTKFVSSRIHNFSHLESIEIYTTADNVNLVEVLNAMAAAGDKLPDEKDPAAIKKYFQKVYPSLDFDRVYNSDLKKMVKWFDILKSNDVEIKLSELPEEEETEEVKEEPVKVKKEAKEKAPAAKKEKEAPAKPAKKTTTAATTKKTKKEEEEEKPAKKKPAAKKK